MMKVKEIIGTAIIGTFILAVALVCLVAFLVFGRWFDINVDIFLLIAWALLFFMGIVAAIAITTTLVYSYWIGNEIYKGLFGKEGEE